MCWHRSCIRIFVNQTPASVENNIYTFGHKDRSSTTANGIKFSMIDEQYADGKFYLHVSKMLLDSSRYTHLSLRFEWYSAYLQNFNKAACSQSKLVYEWSPSDNSYRRVRYCLCKDNNRFATKWTLFKKSIVMDKATQRKWNVNSKMLYLVHTP